MKRKDFLEYNDGVFVVKTPSVVDLGKSYQITLTKSCKLGRLTAPNGKSQFIIAEALRWDCMVTYSFSSILLEKGFASNGNSGPVPNWYNLEASIVHDFMFKCSDSVKNESDKLKLRLLANQIYRDVAIINGSFKITAYISKFFIDVYVKHFK